MISYLIIIFPIFLSVNCSYLDESKTVYFKFKLFKIKIFVGTIRVLCQGVLLEISKKRTVIIPFNKLVNVRKKVEPLKDYHFIKFTSNIEIGNQDNPLSAIVIAHNVNTFFNYLHGYVSCIKPYVKIENSVKVHTDRDELKFKFDLTIIFNLLMIVLSLIKILVGKLNYAIKK